jgi:alkaline phosphatase D
MKIKMKKNKFGSGLVGVFLAALLLLGGYGPKKPENGPWLGNGFRNGWADQHSVTIWTRLTVRPDLNLSGQPFTELTNDEHSALRKISDVDAIHKAQIPEGLTLADMEGACPGSPGEVKLLYFPEGSPGEIEESGWEPVDVSVNFTFQWKLTRLTPGTQYQVEIQARKNSKYEISDRITGSFVTPPKEETPEDISFCIVTGHDYNRRDDHANGHRIYQSMLKKAPDFYVHTGDIEYYDKPNPWALTEPLMRFKWDRLFALPFQREFFRQVTTYFIKDDHDALSNDSYPGMTYGAVSFERGIEIFDSEQFPSNEIPYKTIRWGKDLQVWLVEGRNFRSRNDDPDGPEKTIWGKEQKEWLFRTIEESDATYRLIISPTPILGPDRGNKADNHGNTGFKHEGDEIREFINSHDNVFICNGDRHWQYVSHTEGTRLWEFSCGPGSDAHAGGWNEENRLPEHRFLRVAGGFLMGSVHREQQNVVLKFMHCDVDGNIMHEEIFERTH